MFLRWIGHGLWLAQLLPVPEQELGPQELELSRGSPKRNTSPSGMNRIWTRTACNLDIPALRAVKGSFVDCFCPSANRRSCRVTACLRRYRESSCCKSSIYTLDTLSERMRALCQCHRYLALEGESLLSLPFKYCGLLSCDQGSTGLNESNPVFGGLKETSQKRCSV